MPLVPRRSGILVEPAAVSLDMDSVIREHSSPTAVTLGIYVILTFAILAHGAVEPWSIGILQLLALVVSLAWVFGWLRRRRIELWIPGAALPVAGFVLLGLIQGVETGAASGAVRSLSADFEATRFATLTVICVAVVFVTAANVLQGERRLMGWARYVTVFGLVLAVFAVIQYYTWDWKFYWLRPSRFMGFGPFVNRNHFAGLIEMLVPIPVALILTRAVPRESWLFYGFAAAVMGTSVVVSLSRGGVIALVVGLLFVVAVAVLSGGTAKGRAALASAALVALLVVAIGAGVLWTGAEEVANRAVETVAQAKDTDGRNFLNRGWIWRDTLKLVTDRPFAGVGIGAYETTFHSVASNDGRMIVSQAHNDFLQVLADAGLIGVVLLVWFLGVVVRDFVRALRVPNLRMRAVALGCGAGIFAMLVHSVFDFNLQIPSNVLAFLILVAVVSYVGSKAAGSGIVDAAPGV